MAMDGWAAYKARGMGTTRVSSTSCPLSINMPPIAISALLLSISSFISVSAQTTASIPTVLPGNWTSFGCYTDISTSRTLAATSTTSDNMTVEACITFCNGGGYNLAGLEFGNCDSTIQFPSQATPLTDCDQACSGNATELCGAGNRLNVFYNGEPSPVLVPAVSSTNGDTWTYQGCYTDSVAGRTLASPVNIPIGVTAESCVAACRSLAGYTYAGMEIGRECWCDNSIANTTQRVSDDDCRMVCDANHTEYCGNNNRIAVYHFTEAGEAIGQQPCLDTNVANFTLVAEYRNPPVGGPTSVNLKIVLVELVPNIVWSILSACTKCCSEWPYFTLQNSVFFPQSPNNPSIHSSSTSPGDGESPSFVSLNPAFPGAQSYCTVTDLSSPVGSPPLLSFGGKSDAFSLCANLTANNRLDVVYSPVTGHPHYTLDNCSPVNIQVIIAD